MKIENTRFGDLEISEEMLVHFPQGIIGFSKAKNFVILDHGDQTVIRWLQAIEIPELAFVIVDPLPLVANYPVERLKQEARDVDISDDEDVAIAAIVTIPEHPKAPTVNLLAPLVMGTTSHRGKQVVLQDSPYQTRHSLTFIDA
jgi:flagellar assembly factor FliW